MKSVNRATVLLLFFLLQLKSFICIKVDVSGVFKPHYGLKAKVKFCLECQIFVDLEAEEEAQETINEELHVKAAKAQAKSELAGELVGLKRQKLALETKDPMIGHGDLGQDMLAAPTTVDVPRHNKDKALAKAASLPPGAKDMVIKWVGANMEPKKPMKQIPNPAWSPGSAKTIPKFIYVPVFDPGMGRNILGPVKKYKGKKKVGSSSKDGATATEGSTPSLEEDDDLPKSIIFDPKAKPDSPPPTGNLKKVLEALKAPDRVKAMEIAKKAMRIAEAFGRNANAIMNGSEPVKPGDVVIQPEDIDPVEKVQCSHLSVPVDCCKCCETMNVHCCAYCNKHERIARGEKEVLEDWKTKSVSKIEQAKHAVSSASGTTASSEHKIAAPANSSPNSLSSIGQPTSHSISQRPPATVSSSPKGRSNIKTRNNPKKKPPPPQNCVGNERLPQDSRGRCR
jgi:hypothetical protein